VRRSARLRLSLRLGAVLLALAAIIALIRVPSWQCGSGAKANTEGCDPERFLAACEGGDAYECELGRLFEGRGDLASLSGVLTRQPADMDALLRLLFPAIEDRQIVDQPIPVPAGQVFEHKGFDPYPIPAPVDWRADPQRNNSWRLWFQSLNWFSRYIDGDAKAVETGAALLTDWVNQALYAVPALDQTWKDHAIAIRLDRASRLTTRYIETRRVLDRRFLHAAAQLIVTHLYALAARCRYVPRHNHSVMHDLAILTWVGRFPALRDGPRLRELAWRRLLDEQVRLSVTSDGLHVENSPCYHLFYVQLLNRAIRVAVEAGEAPPKELVRVRDSMIEPLVQLLQPDLSVAQFGDCGDGSHSVKLRRLLADTRKLGGADPSALAPLQWVVSQGRHGKPPRLDRVYEVGGYAVFRDGWDPAAKTGTVAHFKATHFSRVHYHADETAFEIFAHGRELIVQPGVFSYVSDDPFQRYQRSPSGQNVLVVDDDDTVETKPSAGSRIVGHGSDRNIVWVQGTHENYERLGVSSLVRTFAFARPDTFIVIDHVQADESHEYAQHFHLDPDLARPRVVGDRTVVASIDGGPSLTIAAGTRPDRIETPRGVTDGSARKGWYFPDFRVKKPATDVVLRRSAAEVDLPVVIVVSAPGQQPRIPSDIAYSEEGESATVSWRLDGVEHSLRVPRH
jgi:Heparinase II/III-like protein/Heparinase II/III N-terminus